MKTSQPAVVRDVTGDASAPPGAFVLLGGKRILGNAAPTSEMEVHALLAKKGLRFGALKHLTSSAKSLTDREVSGVLGISQRTLIRMREAPEDTMSMDIGSKLWMFAEILAKAVEVFGCREDAEEWLLLPAMGLDNQKPIDLMRTIQGAALVSTFLERLRYGVYQ